MGNQSCPYLPCQSQMTDTTLPRTPENVYFPQSLIDNIPPCQLPLSDIKIFPYKNIGVVISLHPIKKSSFVGTGFLISEDLVLTCAHNICNIQSGRKKHDFILFYPSAHGRLDSQHKATIAYIPDEYFTIDCKSLAPFDYALLKLDEPVRQTQFLTIAQNFEDFKTEAPISIFGYPSGNKFQEVKNEDGKTVRYMWQAGLSESNKIFEDKNSLTLKRLLYQISTESGQSGAPIMIKKEGNLVVIGLHQGGCQIDVRGQKVACNVGRRFTQDLMANLKKWRQECNGSNYDSFDYKTFKKSVIRRATIIREPIYQSVTSAKSTNPRQQSYYISKYWDLTLPFVNNFFIEKQIATRMFIRNQSYYQVVSAQPLPAYSITRFRFDFYGGNQSLILGIVTAAHRQESWSKGLGNGSLGLITNKKLAMGAIFRQGSPIEQWKRSLFIEEGQIVTMEVNKPQGVMSFQRSKTLDKFEFKLGRFADWEIFTFVCMRNKDSAITYLPQK